VTGTVSEHRRAGTLIAVSAAKRKHPGKPRVKIVTVTVAQTSVSLPAGTTETVSLSLNGVGRQALARFRKLPLTLSVSGVATTAQVVLNLPRLRVNVGTPPDNWFHINAPCGNCYTTPQSVPITGIPKGTQVAVFCSGSGCPFSQRSVTPHAGQINLASVLGGAKLQPGAKVQVVITAPGSVGEVVTYTMQRGAGPLRTESPRP
jgi:hypothetical protein